MKFIRSLTKFKYPISTIIHFTVVTKSLNFLAQNSRGFDSLQDIFLPNFLLFKKNCLLQKTNTELKILFGNIVNTDDLQMISAC